VHRALRVFRSRRADGEGGVRRRSRRTQGGRREGGGRAPIVEGVEAESGNQGVRPRAAGAAEPAATARHRGAAMGAGGGRNRLEMAHRFENAAGRAAGP
jgi:hypothetical protein